MNTAANLRPTVAPYSPAAANVIDPFPPLGRGFIVALAMYVLVAVPKVNALVPFTDVLRPAKLLAVVVLLMAMNTHVGGRIQAVFGTKVAKAVIVIMVFMVAGAPFSLWPSNSVGYILATGIPTFFLFVFSAAAFTDRRAIPLLVATWVFGAGVGALRMLAPGAMTEQGRVMMSLAFDPNESAALLVCTLPFAMWMATRRGRGRILAGVAALVYVVAIMKTGSRGGLLGLAAMGLLMLAVSPPKRRLAYIAATVVLAAVASVAASSDFRSRITAVFSDDKEQKDYNFTDREGRVAVWKRGIGYMVSHPLLGVGVDAFETAEGTISGKTNEGYGVRYTAAHNSFVQIGAELGIFGLLSYITAIVFAAIGLWRVRRQAIAARAYAPALADPEVALAAAALSSLVGIMSTGFFLSFGYHSITMFVWAVCIGVFVGSPFARPGAAAALGGAGAPAAPEPAAPLLVPTAPVGGRFGRRSAGLQAAPRQRGTPGWRSRGL